MKTKTNRFLSIFMIITMLVSLLTSLTMTAFAEDYPGGVLLYESFTGIVEDATTSPTPQPAGTVTTTYRKKVGNDTGAGLGDYARQKDNSSTNFNATLPTSYLVGAETALVAAQGPNAKLTLEFDFKFDGDVPTEQKTLTAVLLGNSSLAGNNSTARGNSAIAIFLQSPNVVRIYRAKSSYDDYYLPTGITFDQWHRYQVAVDLTNASSEGASTYTFTIDGKNLVDGEGTEVTSFTKKLSATDITKLHIDTTNTYTTGLDNISVYKTTTSNAALSTGALMTKLHEVNAELAGYQAAAEGTEVLTNLETAVTAAGTMVTSAFGTYDANGAVVTAAKTQAEVDAALTALINAEAALEEHLSGVTYPGGVLLYESFTGIVGSTETVDIAAPTYQPVGTTATTRRKREGADSGAGLGAYAKQHEDNSTTNFTATIPTAYLDAHTDTSQVAAQGANAQLTLEFDFKFDGEVPTEASTLTAVSIGNSDVSTGSTGRGNAAIAIYLQSPNVVRIYRAKSSYDDYYLPTGITFDQWHRYQVAVDLTNASSEGASTYTFTIDGKNLVDGEGTEVTSFTKKLSVTEITKLRIDTTNAYATRLDNVSVYKTTETYASLSTGALMTKLHEVNAKMEAYQAAAEGTAELTNLQTAVTAAGTMVTSAFGTYDATGAEVTAPTTQANVDAALASLTAAENALIAVLPPYYIAGHTTDETTGALTGITVKELSDYTAISAKLIVATYDTDGMVEASIQNFTAAGEITLDESMDVTDKLVKIFIWDIGGSSLLHLAPVYTFGEAVDQD